MGSRRVLATSAVAADAGDTATLPGRRLGPQLCAESGLYGPESAS